MAYVTSGGCMILPLLNNNCQNTDTGHGDPPPDGDGDGGVAHRDDHSRHDEDGEGDQAHVALPLPRLREVYPALGAVIWPG